MNIEKTLSYGGNKYSGKIFESNICPLCKHAIKPVELLVHPFEDEDKNRFAGCFYLCQNCSQVFVSLHKCSCLVKKTPTGFSTYSYSSELLYVGPEKFQEQAFDQKVVALSPSFVKIYNQALAAESFGLDEIAGIGYRKSLEFLTKDFCTHENPDKKQEIEILPLAKCIKNYIDNPQIDALATRAAWIGNDETHYVRRLESLDISDMKAFIQAMVYFVGMVLISEQAASISPA